MSAFPSYPFPGVAQDNWVTAAQLAAATGKPKRTIQWNCKTGDLRHCHRWTDNPNGGPMILQVNLSFAPEAYRLAYARRQTHEHGEAHNYTEKQLAQATAIHMLLLEVEAHVRAQMDNASSLKEKDLIDAFLAGRRISDSSVPSVRTYYRHRSRWLAGGRRPSALVDGRSIAGGGVKAEMDEEAFAFFCSLYLTQDQRHASICYERTAEKAKLEGWVFPSLATVMRAVKERVPKSKFIELREGKEARRNKADAHIPRDWSELAGNESWVSDHCELDVIGIDDLPGGTGDLCRMWLTTWMDERSRYVVGARVHRGPNAVEVMASIHDAILNEGIPGNIRIDNGKEYRCHRFAGGRQWRQVVEKVTVDETAVRPVLLDLGITPHYAAPYNARAKIVEPWHNHCIKQHFSKWMPGYCGGSPEERPEQLAEIIAKWKKSGEGLLPWSKLIELLKEVIDAYHKRGHEGLGGKCPAFVRQETLVAAKKADPRTLALLLQECIILTIGQQGLSVKGAAYGIGDPIIAARQGERVKVRIDSMRIGSVHVFDLKGRYITAVENAGRLAAYATEDDVRDYKRRVTRHNKLADEMATQMPILTSVDPVAAIALSKLATRGAQQADPRADGPIIKADFAARADDGTLAQLPDTLPFRPVSPAPDGSKVIRMQVDTKVRTDAPNSDVVARVLPDDILEAFSAG